MAITHNGKIVSEDTNILLDKWGLNTVFGDEKAKKPSYCIFRNVYKAIEMLKKHIDNRSRTVLHTDVDVDGVGTTYIMLKVLRYMGLNQLPIMINKDKVHGISQKHPDYLNSNNIADFVIITDSSSNEINVIKQFNCDVLVIDHHDMIHDETFGKCNDGIHNFVIVNSTIENNCQEIDNELLRKSNPVAFENIDEYKGCQDMSCGLVVYELLRVYCAAFSDEKILENMQLYQWAGITLYTDVIDTINERNQWYLDNTVFSRDIESTLGTVLKQLNSYKCSIDKSYIQYTFAPVINKAIRAGKSTEVIDKIINNPYRAAELREYDSLQEDAINKTMFVDVDTGYGTKTKAQRTFSSETIMFDTTPYGIHPNYNGVIAGRLAGETGKNTAVFQITPDGICKGSFRGAHKKVDYRKFFSDYADNVYAQGHPPAFGFELRKEQLEDIMSKIKSIEPTCDNKPFITVGDIDDAHKGEYHVDDINELRRLGYIWKIATGNAKVISPDEIFIRVKASDVHLKQPKDKEKASKKLLVYTVFGMDCKAFKPLSGDYFDIYLEYTREVEAYIRMVKS